MNEYGKTPTVSTLRNLSPWAPSWQLIKENWRILLTLSGLGIVLPLMIVDLSQSMQAAESAQTIRQLSQDAKSPHVNQFVETTLSFLGSYLIGWALCFLVVAASFLALLIQCQAIYQGQGPLPLVTCFKEGAKLLIFRGILSLALSLLSLLLVGNLLVTFFGPSSLTEIFLLLFFALHLTIPVLLVQAPDKPFRTLMKAMSLSYAPPAKGAKWTIFFQILGWELMFLLTLTLSGFVRSGFLNLDLWLGLPRSQWLSTFAYLPFGPAYITASLLSTLLFSAMLGALAVLMTVFFTHLERANLLLEGRPIDQSV